MSAAKDGYLVRLVPLASLPEDGDAPPLAIALTPWKASDPKLELTGIGAVLRAEGDALDIQQVVPGAGAADAGLGPGDTILAIDGARVANLGFEGAVGAIRGPEGTTVKLRIRRAGRAGRRGHPQARAHLDVDDGRTAGVRLESRTSHRKEGP